VSDINFDSLNLSMGWLDNPAAVRAVIRTDGIKPVSDHLKGKRKQPVRTDLSLYLKKVFGNSWFLHQGLCGSCVAQCVALSCDTLAAIRTVEYHENLKPGRTDPMTIYIGSRVEIGGNSLPYAGTYVAWAAKYVKDYGTVIQAKYPEMDLSQYDASVCCGKTGGVPPGIKAIAKNRQVKSYAHVRTFDELALAIESGYPVIVSSNVGFDRRRDADGFSPANQIWGHCLTALGVRHDRPGALMANSWGAYYTGGPKGMSAATKWVDKDTVNRMLAQGDSFALADLENWNEKSISLAKLNF
jgi:hypothetical protein